MDDLTLSIETPILLSPESREKLDSVRKRLRRDTEGVEAKEESGPAEEKGEVLERAYEDVRHSLKPEQPPLSVRLRKLWSERGDFSRFRASTLVSPEGGDNEKEEEGGNEWDLGANLNGSLEVQEQLEGEDKQDGFSENDDKVAQNGKDIMSIHDMLQLRSKMMERLGLAQNALYFSHAMVSLLINSTKADQASTSNPSAARAGSPTSTSAGGVVASTSALQRNSNATNVMGSAANLEAELGVEPHVFGASRLEAERKEVEPRGEAEEEGEEEEDNGLEEDEEDLEREAQLLKKQDKKLSATERDEKARELVDCYQGKKQGIASAVNILRRGASALRGSEERKQRDEMRWQLLSQSKRTGWGLIPDKPIRGTSNGKRELLEDGNRRRDEPSRDAWIGYAVPEAQFAYRRRALAYFNHDSTKVLSSPGEALAFASRTKQSLRVRFVIGDEEWTSEKDLKNIVSDTVESQLRLAQMELADRELFDAIVNECRAMGSSSSLFPATIDNEDGVSISLNGTTLFLEMVKDEVGDKRISDKTHYSALAATVLSLLHLGLICQYRLRAGATLTRLQSVPSKKKMDDEILRTPLLLPILGSLHFASFISRLKTVLENVKRANPKKTYELHGLEKVQNCQKWLETLLQGSHAFNVTEAMEYLGGSATVYYEENPFAFLTLSYPSAIALSLPRKKNSGGGIHLSRVDIRLLENILIEELP